MKKFIYSLVFAFLLGAGTLFAQSPEAINYQGVARDASGNPLPSQNISLRISILSGSASGTLEYQETHFPTTNTLGLFNVKIGQGTAVSGSFPGIDWANNSHFVEVEMDPNGGTSYSSIGTQELVSVPYALHATTVEFDNVDDADADSTNELQNLSISGNDLTISDGNTVTLPSFTEVDGDTTNELQTLSISGSDISISDGNTITLPVEVDGDTTNELQTLILAGDTLTLTNGNSVILSGSDADWVISGNDIYNANTGNVGVGTTTPLYKLTVGSPDSTGVIAVGHSGNFNDPNSGRLIFSEDVDFTSGTCGFEWQYDGATNVLSLVNGCTSLADTNIWFQRGTSDAVIPGRLSLGTNANPTANLDVAGTFRYADGNQAAGRLLQSDAAGNATWANIPLPTQVWNDLGADVQPASLENVLSGGDFITSAGNGVINCGGGAMNSIANIISDVTPTPTVATGDEDLYIDDDLEVSSQAYKPGGGSWAAISDRRLKTNISSYNDGLSAVLKIEPVWFEYNDRVQIHSKDKGKKFVGIIAQDMQAIAPYMVEERALFQEAREDEQGKETITKEGEQFLTYDPSALDYMLVNSVKELNGMIEKQNELIDLQSEKIRQLEAEIEKLRNE